MKGWHFLQADGCLGYGDGRKVVVGETLTVDCEPILCVSGLHASTSIIDALKYAPGPVCSYVDLGGTVIHGDDKSVATERHTIWMADISNLLFEAACRFAESALLREREAGREPDQRSWRAIEIRRKWLQGKATDDELIAARAKAWAATRAAAAAARAKAWAAAWAAAAAARAEARAAAWDAAATARAAAWAEQNTLLELMVRELMEGC